MVRLDQQIYFNEIHCFFDKISHCVKDIPNLVKQLNICRDEKGLLRVKSKFKKWRESENFPLLLSKNSHLSKLIILDLHEKVMHGGCYSVLSALRDKFWIPQCFSLVKKTIKSCINCKKVNSRTIKLNQSPYRDFRVDPPSIPYRYLFLDYFGPYEVKLNHKRTKVYILCLTCLWSWAINLKLCLDMTVGNFLRAFQLHIFEFGIPEICLSDMGSQIV